MDPIEPTRVDPSGWLSYGFWNNTTRTEYLRPEHVERLLAIHQEARAPQMYLDTRLLYMSLTRLDASGLQRTTELGDRVVAGLPPGEVAAP